MIMRPRKGELVDHFDGNGLNNGRCNLRVCMPAQNRANSRPCAGEYHYLGLFDDPVEAAKAGDRKAYELHGPYPYLNFPQDFPRPGEPKGKGRPGQ
jgi:hypothetical protein